MTRAKNTNRIRLTPASIAGVKPPIDRPRIEISDEETPALRLRVTATGGKSLSFVYRSRRTGRKARVLVTVWPTDPYTDAATLKTLMARVRRDVADLKYRVGQVECPATDRAVTRAERAAAQAAARTERKDRIRQKAIDENGWEEDSENRSTRSVLEEYLGSPKVRKMKTSAQIAGKINHHWLGEPSRYGKGYDIGAIPIKDLRRKHLRPRLDELEREGRHGSYNEALKHIRAALKWAVGRDIIETNPAHALEKASTVPRDRDLSEREVGAFWIATGELPAPWRQAFRLLLATGCRMTEVLASREGDYENGDWLTLHGRRRKTNETIRVAIPAIAKAELQSLPALTDGEYLFTCNGGESAARGLRKPLDTIVKPKMAELLGEAPDYFERDENHFVIHDLRRTCRTHLSRIGIDPFVAERCLGHAVGKIQATYDRYSYDREKRAAVDRWGKEIKRLARGLKAKQ